MDVLQLIKRDHDGLRSLLAQLSSAKTVTARRKVISQLAKNIELHLNLEAEYLYPEVMDLYNGSTGFITTAAERQKKILRQFRALSRVLSTKGQKAEKTTVDKKIDNFSKLMNEHLVEEEDWLLPKVRAHISTQEREDLAQVFLDVYEEFGLDRQAMLH